MFRKILLFLLALLVLLCLITYLFMQFAPSFGGKPNAASLAKIQASPQYQNGSFVNQTETRISYSPSNLWGMTTDYVKASNTAPKAPLVTAFDALKTQPNESLTVNWLGHSAVWLQLEGLHILLDPMLGPAASPVSFFGKRFPNSPGFEWDFIPEKIDAVIFSHDHYDHLDYPSIVRLRDRVVHFYVPLGLGAHLLRWGVKENQITEMDWWQEAQVNHIRLVAAPARHFSGRGIGDANQTLWASWVISGHDHQLYFSGDSGYGPHFREIAARFGPFDLALMECGQYNERWEAVHMLPHQTVQATLDVQAHAMMPIHWGAFTLAPHAWTEPVEQLLQLAPATFHLVTPRIGEPFGLSQLPQSSWWR